MGAPPPPQAPQFSPQTPSQLSPMMRPSGGATPTQRPPQLSPFGAQTSPAAGANGGAAGQWGQRANPAAAAMMNGSPVTQVRDQARRR